MLDNSEGQPSELDRCRRPAGMTNVPPAHEPENPRVLVETITRCDGIHPPATRRHRDAASRDHWQGGGGEERSPQPATAAETPTRPPARPDPGLPHPTPARPGPVLTHLQTQGRPAGAQELADVAQALALVPRLRVDLQHTASLSGPDASSAPYLGLHQSPPPARTRKCAPDRK